MTSALRLVDRTAGPSRLARPAWTAGGLLAFWMSVAVVLVFSQFWVLPVTGPVPDVSPAVSASLRNYYFPAYFVGLALAMTRLGELGAAVARSPFCALLVAVAFMSALWSIDPAVTGRRGVAVLFTTLSGIAIAARYGWPSFLEVFAAGFAVIVALCFLIVWLAPSYGLMSVDFPGAWRGVWDHKNTLGYNMSVALVVFVAAAILRPSRRWLWAAPAGAALLLVVLSASKTSLVSCAVAGLCVALVWLGRRGPGGAVVAAYVAIALVFAAALLFIVDPGFPFSAIGKDESFTGRTRIWDAVLRQIAKRPWTGYGYGAVWDETSRWGPLPWISKQQGFVVHEAHNSWLAIWLELGYLGLIAAIVALSETWIRAVLGAFRRSSSYFTLPFLAIFTLHTITEAAILSQNDLIWLLFAAVALKLASPEDAVEADRGFARPWIRGA